MPDDEYGDNYDGCFKGYIFWPRTTMYLIRDLKMDFAIYGFYNALVSLADWDSRRKTFGFVKLNGYEISKALNISESLYSRYKKRLDKFGLTKQTKIGLRLLEYKRFSKEIVQFMSKKTIVDRKSEIAVLQDLISLSQEEIANLQESKAKSVPSFNVPFNGGDLEEIDPKEVDRYWNTLQS